MHLLYAYKQILINTADPGILRGGFGPDNRNQFAENGNLRVTEVSDQIVRFASGNQTTGEYAGFKRSDVLVPTPQNPRSLSTWNHSTKIAWRNIR